MPHLDDGQIAEWIDGTDWPHGQTARDEVADHLRQCTVCRERVEEARAIAQRARAILGAAAPPVADAPPFDVVLARAGRTAVRRPTQSAWRWLAWAATVVIAGGLGWYVRGEQLRQSVGTAQVPVSASAMDSAAPLAEAPRNQVGVGAVGGVPAPAPGRTANEPAPIRQETNKARADLPAAVAKGVAREADEALRDTAREGAPGQLPRAPAAAAAPTPNPSGNALGVTAMPEERPAASGLAIARDGAERVLGGPVAQVPDLPVARYELLAPGMVVRVIQTLPSGAPLELIECLALAAEPKADIPRAQQRTRLALVADGTSGDTVTVQGLRVRGRAAVTPDSLRALLARIRR